MPDILQHDLEKRIHQELPHLTAEDRCALVRLIEHPVEACQPNRIYLFDLKVCGDYGPDSDCDLMVVVQQTTEPSYRLAQQAHIYSGTSVPLLTPWYGVSMRSRADCT
jgi:hypothetical protein